MIRSAKKSLINEYSTIFKTCATGILIEFQGMSVEEITQLRKRLYESGSKMRILKNTLAFIASKGTPLEKIQDHFVNTRALIYNPQDVVAPAKVIVKYVKEFETLSVISGVLVTGEKSEILDTEGVTQLGNLPGKEELTAKLLFLLKAPITNFVRTLNEIPASLVRVLEAISDSKN